MYFGLSVVDTEDAIYYSQAIRAFMRIDLSLEAAPNATTLLTSYVACSRCWAWPIWLIAKRRLFALDAQVAT